MSRSQRFSPATTIALVALLLSLTGTAGAALVTSSGIATNAVLSKHIRAGGVTVSDLGTRSVTNAKLALGAVRAPNVAAGAISTTKVADGSLTGADVLDGSIAAGDLAPGLLGAAALADGSVTGSKLAGDSVTASLLADGTVASADLADGSVATVDLAGGAVTTVKLADGAVTGAKLGTSIAAAVTATNVPVADDALGTMPSEEADGLVVSFAASEFDTASLFDLAGQPTRLTAPIAGLYEASLWVSWDAAGSGYREAQLLVNGTTIIAQDRTNAGSSMGNRPNQSLDALVSLAAGGFVQARISHQAGLSLNADRVRLTLHRVGSA